MRQCQHHPWRSSTGRRSISRRILHRLRRRGSGHLDSLTLRPLPLMTGWFPALRLARSPSTRPRHWPVFAVLRPRSRGSHNSVSDTRLVPSCVTTIGSTTSTDRANRARTAPRDSIVTQYRIRFAGMTKCRIANMQLTTFHGPRCDPRIALCSFPPTGRLTVTNCRFAAMYRQLPRKMTVRHCALVLDLRQT